MEGNAVLMAHAGAAYVGRQELLALRAPDSTATHQVVPHGTLVGSLIESLGMRGIEIVRDQYALTPDGMKLFGVLEVNLEHSGVRLALGIRNSHDKTFSLGLTVGYRVFVCDNLAFDGEFQAIAKKHSKHLNLVDVLDQGVSRMQRSFEPMKRRIDAWKGFELTDLVAKEIIYRAFIEDELDAPKHLAKLVHKAYFEPPHKEFEPRTMWSLTNGFTEAFKVLDPIPQMRATADLGRFIATTH